MLKKTPLNDIHVKSNAKMVDFSGWLMPVQYSSVVEEHKAVREKVGIFDICHMGEIEVKGEKSLEFLQRLMTNDISRLDEGKALYTSMCNEQGFVIDDMFVYKLKDKYFLVVNSGNIEKDLEWLKKNKIEDIEIKNVSEETAKLDIQGPNSEKVLQKLTSEDLSSIKRFYSKEILLNNIPTLISRTGYTGEDGFEIYFNFINAEDMWNNILVAGEEFDIKPCGLGARDVLRIEASYSLYGHEVNEKITPIEAGIKFVVNFDKDFIGKEALKKHNEEGIKKRLVCFEMVDRAIPRENYKIHDKEVIGHVTSGTFSPLLEKGIGMGYINKDLDEIFIEIRGNILKAKVVERPFYKYNKNK